MSRMVSRHTPALAYAAARDVLSSEYEGDSEVVLRWRGRISPSTPYNPAAAVPFLHEFLQSTERWLLEHPLEDPREALPQIAPDVDGEWEIDDDEEEDDNDDNDENINYCIA